MKFISKELSIKLRNKGFDKPCFGWYYIETPTGFIDGELVLNRYSCRGGTYKETLERHIDFQPKEGFVGYINSNIVDAPTIDQTLEWLREEKKIYVGIAYMPKIDDNTDFYYPTIQKIGDFEPTHFGDNADEIFNSYDDACIAGIEYVVEHLI
jgi:hypothetical protein